MTVHQLIKELEKFPLNRDVNVAIFNSNGDGVGDATVMDVRDDVDEFRVVSIVAEINPIGA